MFEMFQEYVRAIELILAKAKYLLMSEFFIWLTIALMFSWPIIVRLTWSHSTYEVFDIFSSYNLEMSFSVLILIFPLVFQQVYGVLPLRYFRSRVRGHTNTPEVPSSIAEVDFDDGAVINESISASDINSSLSILKSAYLESKQLSEKIYSRSGIYLMFGVLIAIGGIVFFSFHDFKVDKTDSAGLIVLKMAPYFGVLLFVELIAFFFLRQYRALLHKLRFRHKLPLPDNGLKDTLSDWRTQMSETV